MDTTILNNRVTVEKSENPFSADYNNTFNYFKKNIHLVKDLYVDNFYPSVEGKSEKNHCCDTATLIKHHIPHMHQRPSSVVDPDEDDYAEVVELTVPAIYGTANGQIYMFNRNVYHTTDFRTIRVDTVKTMSTCRLRIDAVKSQFKELHTICHKEYGFAVDEDWDDCPEIPVRVVCMAVYFKELKTLVFADTCDDPNEANPIFMTLGIQQRRVNFGGFIFMTPSVDIVALVQSKNLQYGDKIYAEDNLFNLPSLDLVPQEIIPTGDLAIDVESRILYMIMKQDTKYYKETKVDLIESMETIIDSIASEQVASGVRHDLSWKLMTIEKNPGEMTKKDLMKMASAFLNKKK